MKKAGIGLLLWSIPMNLVVYPMIVLWTLFGICALPFLFALWKIFTHHDLSRIMRKFIWYYGKGWVAITSPFVRFRRVGFDTFALEPPYVIVINHHSFFDFYCMGLLPFDDLAAAVRSWPFKMPWYAPFMRLAGYLDVEALGASGYLAQGARIIGRKGSVLFFPEGHRSKDGKLQRFFSGAFKLAKETGTKVLPLCMTGTETLLPPGRWWMLPARIDLAVLPPVDPTEFQGSFAHRDLTKHVRGLMEEKLTAMRAA